MRADRARVGSDRRAGASLRFRKPGRGDQREGVRSERATRLNAGMPRERLSTPSSVEQSPRSIPNSEFSRKLSTRWDGSEGSERAAEGWESKGRFEATADALLLPTTRRATTQPSPHFFPSLQEP